MGVVLLDPNARRGGLPFVRAGLFLILAVIAFVLIAAISQRRPPRFEPLAHAETASVGTFNPNVRADVVEPVTAEDQKILELANQFSHQIPWETCYLECDYDAKSVSLIKEFSNEVARYLTSAPPSAFKSARLLQFFHDAVETRYLLHGKAAALAWAVQHARVADSPEVSEQLVVMSARMDVARLEELKYDYEWQIPITVRQ